jgi:hypothetical protein
VAANKIAKALLWDWFTQEKHKEPKRLLQAKLPRLWYVTVLWGNHPQEKES